MRLNNTAFFGACFAAGVASFTVAMVVPSCSAATRQALECQLNALDDLPHNPDELTVGDLHRALYELRACRVVEQTPPDAGAP